jgi:ornithine carbamoyltransferase
MAKNFISISDLSAEQIKGLLEEAVELKKQPVTPHPPLPHRSMAMIFDKPSLRTRLSFEVGMTQLGGHAVYLAPDDIKLGKRESVHDTAKVVSSMVDVIVARVSSHADMKEMAKHSSVPVINAMTDLEHPCQIMADLLTLHEHFGSLDGLKLAYLGDADNNVTNSLALAAEALGLELRVASPKGYEMSEAVARRAPSVKHGTDVAEAVEGADVVVTDTWVSMGKEAEAADRLKALELYRVDAALMAKASKRAVFLHCLPAYRGKEVSAEVIDGPQSLVYPEAENRLHAQKAVVLSLLR